MRRTLRNILTITLLGTTVAVGATDCMVMSANASPVVRTVSPSP